eukprot:13448158-Alexandrium_andersonii.AAC.1
MHVRNCPADAGLVVEAICPGGAAEDWSRQCADGAREIRTGDRAVKVNGAEDPDGMREQFLTRCLLAMT